MLSRFIKKKHEKYRDIKKFVEDKALDIPEYTYNMPTPLQSLEMYLAKEFFEACKETILVDTVKKKDETVWFFKYRLKKVSLSEFVRTYTKYPLGLAVEYLLHKRQLKCPVSGKSLVANGGSGGAWCDLTCPTSKVNVEVKTKWDMAKAYPSINAGSYRWYKAQEAAGIRNFMVLVPRKGGRILMCDIKRVYYRIDDKFCAFYNSEYRDDASLRSYVKLTNSRSVGVVDRKQLDLLEKYSKKFMLKMWHVYFGSRARKIQRLWKRYKEKAKKIEKA